MRDLEIGMWPIRVKGPGRGDSLILVELKDEIDESKVGG